MKLSLPSTLAGLALLGLLTQPASIKAQSAVIPASLSLPLLNQNVVPSYHLGVGFQKTTHLIFPFAVSYVDLGSTDIIADKAKNAENIVKVKANVKGFNQTNMTVLTSDGKLYSFLVDYEADPRVINVNFSGVAPSISNPIGVSGGKNMVQFSGVDLTENQLVNYSSSVITKKRSVRHRDKHKDDITLGLHGMYTVHDAFFFKLYMFNSSHINYDIDFIKFSIRDKKVAKRTAVQESEIEPLFVYHNEQGTIPGTTMVEKVFVYHKFTIPNDKTLVVEMFERGGGRHLAINISNEDILAAQLLPKI